MPLFQSFLPKYLILNSYFFATLMALTIGSAISSMPKNSQFPGIPSQYSYSYYIQYMLAHDHRMRVGVVVEVVAQSTPVYLCIRAILDCT